MNDSPFMVNERWSSDRDVRDYGQLPDWSIGQPHGILRTFTGARLSGKTRFLEGLRHQLKTRKLVKYVELLALNEDVARTRFLALPESTSQKLKNTVLLIDEPGPLLTVDPHWFLETCRRIAEKEVRIVMALSAGEFETLQKADPSKKLNQKDQRFIPAFSEEDSTRMIERPGEAARWSLTDLKSLPAEWKSHPFRLELFLEISWHEEPLPLSVETLLETAIQESADPRHTYAETVFRSGLTESQRNCLRDIRDGDEPDPRTVKLLEECRLVVSSLGRWRISDPILADWLPPPFRIHHVSDVHVGPKSAFVADNKVEDGALKDKLNVGVGNVPSRDSYLTHLEQLLTNGEGPQVVIVSGDLIETGEGSELDDAVNWMTLLKTTMQSASHPRLKESDSRVLLVAGNHDVMRLKSLALDDPQARHRDFCEQLAEFDPPRLDVPPESRDVSTACFSQAEIDVLLLSSSEFGSDAGDDAAHEVVAGKLRELEEQLGADNLSAKNKQEIMQQIAWIDPGLVHSLTLEKAAAFPWGHPIRIAVLHHPVSPLPCGTEVARFSGLVNAGQVKRRLLNSGFFIALHGHAHYGWLASESWNDEAGSEVTLHISSAPSLGSWAKDEKNGYNELVFVWEGDDCFLTMRVVARDGSEWKLQHSRRRIQIVRGGKPL